MASSTQKLDGIDHVVHRWTDDNRSGSFFPVVLGYAATQTKTQGFTVAHVTGVPDINLVPRAGWTVISGVRPLGHFAFLRPPERDLFKLALIFGC